jgi:hypothetical protein
MALTQIGLLITATICAGAEFDHSAWARVLETRVNAVSEVDYAGLKGNRKDLDTYMSLLAEASPEKHAELFPTTAHELAYWLNAYNAFITRGVVDRYPVASVRDLGFLWGFFRQKIFTAGGTRMSLNRIEHDILRKRFLDPRIHFAIVCASVSCPRLSREAFRAEGLHDHLDRLARQFMNERRSVTIDPGRGEVRLNSIFKWYREDFEKPMGDNGPKQSLIAYIRLYLSDANRKVLDELKEPKISFHDYDWGLNEPGSRARAESALERELANPRVH